MIKIKTFDCLKKILGRWSCVIGGFILLLSFSADFSYPNINTYLTSYMRNNATNGYNDHYQGSSSCSRWINAFYWSFVQKDWMSDVNIYWVGHLQYWIYQHRNGFFQDLRKVSLEALFYQVLDMDLCFGFHFKQLLLIPTISKQSMMILGVTKKNQILDQSARIVITKIQICLKAKEYPRCFFFWEVFLQFAE